MATVWSGHYSTGTYTYTEVKVDYSGTRATAYLMHTRTNEYYGTEYTDGATFTFGGQSTSFAYSVSGPHENVIIAQVSFDISMSGGTYSGSTSGEVGPFSFSGSVTIPAQNYTITYDANGGSNAPASQTKTPGTALTLSTATPSRSSVTAGSVTITFNGSNGTVIGGSTATSSRYTNYAFSKWNTAANGSGTNYNPGATYTTDANAILYAQWTSSTTAYDAITLPGGFRQGYTLLGWSTTSGSSTITSGMTVGASYTPTTNKTIYAVWKQQSVSLRLAQEIFDLIYPIGSIYLSIGSTNPSTLFGGTWVQIKDTFLLSAGDTYTAGATGGEATHTLTANEVPEMSFAVGHIAYADAVFRGIKNVTHEINDNAPSGNNDEAQNASMWNHRQHIYTFGGDGAHNNMPPYQVVYVWKRTA